jgi:hypothetical protein
MDLGGRSHPAVAYPREDFEYAAHFIQRLFFHHSLYIWNVSSHQSNIIWGDVSSKSSLAFQLGEMSILG